MMNLAFILKSFGVKITSEQVAAIEALIPQIPGKIQQTIEVINAALANFDQRLKALEQDQNDTMDYLCREFARVLEGQWDIIKQVEDSHGRNDSDGDTRSAGIGATERARNLSGNSHESGPNS